MLMPLHSREADSRRAKICSKKQLKLVGIRSGSRFRSRSNITCSSRSNGKQKLGEGMDASTDRRKHMLTSCSRKLPNILRKRSICTCDVSKSIRLTIAQFDSRKGATWHCIVGRNFGSFVTHGKVAD
jgi:Dynein light chain type 1